MEDIESVVGFVTENGGIDYATTKMYQYSDRALAILDTYPDSEVRNSLREFVNYTVMREK